MQRRRSAVGYPCLSAAGTPEVLQLHVVTYAVAREQPVPVRDGEPATSERIAATLYGLNAWASLGGELAALGPHEAYRPWGPDFAEGSPSSASLESARSLLTRRQLSNAEACSGLADWAHGFAGAVTEHALPPVFRLGAITWFARVALSNKGRAA
jgi:hypothetical protein